MIRPYKDKDQFALLEVLELNTPPFFDATEKADFEKYLTEENSTYFVAEHKGKIVGGGGYCFLDDPSIAEISWVLFHPDHSRKGFGTQIMHHCLNLLKKNERVKKIIVETSQFAYKFFQKFGFKLVRFEKEYWGKLDLYWMEKKAKR